MRVRIEPSRAVGEVTAPPSKSIAHRLIISAALADGVSTLHGVSKSADVLATLDCISALGVKYDIVGDSVKIYGKGHMALAPLGTLNARESGSTMRFFIPIALTLKDKITLVGAPSLLSRPMDIYREICEKAGLSFSANECGITVCGPLPSGELSLPGNVSSQFISGLLFALPTLNGDSRIRIIPPIESRSYIELTRVALSEFGIVTEWESEDTLFIRGGQKYSPRELTVEGDYSGAANLASFNLFGGEVEVLGLNPKSAQGDAIYSKHFESLSREAASIDLTDCPDLGPILFTVAAANFGARFFGTSRLKIKESDRVAAMIEELSKLGARVTDEGDSVLIEKSVLHAPSVPLSAHNDHRIVMSLAVLLSRFGGEIEDAETVAKSYPGFFADIAALGIKVTEYEA